MAQGHELLGDAVIHLVCEAFTCFEGCALPQRGKDRCHVHVGTVSLDEMDQSVKPLFQEWSRRHPAGDDDADTFPVLVLQVSRFHRLAPSSQVQSPASATPVRSHWRPDRLIPGTRTHTLWRRLRRSVRQMTDVCEGRLWLPTGNDAASARGVRSVTVAWDEDYPNRLRCLSY